MPFFLDNKNQDFHFEILFRFDIKHQKIFFSVHSKFIFHIYYICTITCCKCRVSFFSYKFWKVDSWRRNNGFWFGKSSVENLMVKTKEFEFDGEDQSLWLIGSQICIPNLNSLKGFLIIYLCATKPGKNFLSLTLVLWPLIKSCLGNNIRLSS